MFDLNNVSLKNLFIGAGVIGSGACIGWNGTKLVSKAAAAFAIGATYAVKSLFSKEEVAKVEDGKAA